MRELVLTDDIVLVSYLEALLGGAGIDIAVLDRNVSALNGAAGRVPQRILVPEVDTGSKRISLDAHHLLHPPDVVRNLGFHERDGPSTGCRRCYDIFNPADRSLLHGRLYQHFFNQIRSITPDGCSRRR